jgi:hypothetical protein
MPLQGDVCKNKKLHSTKGKTNDNEPNKIDKINKINSNEYEGRG